MALVMTGPKLPSSGWWRRRSRVRTRKLITSPLPLNRVPRAALSSGKLARFRSSRYDVPYVPAASTSRPHAIVPVRRAAAFDGPVSTGACRM